VQVFIVAKVNHPLHLFLTLITGGLWLVSWIAFYVGQIRRPWECRHCGWREAEPLSLSTKPTSRNIVRPPFPPDAHEHPWNIGRQRFSANNRVPE